MQVKIGSYALKIKTYNHSELGLDKSYEDISFMLYQKFFFILIIPILPMEKYWKIKNHKTNEFIETTPELRTQLNLVALKKKNPIWSYTGSILFLLPFLYFIFISIGQVLNFDFNSVSKEDLKEMNIEQTINSIKTPKINDLFLFEMIQKNNDENKKIKKKYFEYSLIEFTTDSISLKLIGNRYKSSNIQLKQTVKLSKEELTEITGKFKVVKTMYYKDTIGNVYFKLDEIQRNTD